MAQAKPRKAVVQALTELFRWNNIRSFDDLYLHKGNQPMLHLSWNTSLRDRPPVAAVLLATETEIRQALAAANRAVRGGK